MYEEEINGFIYREYKPLGKPRFLVIGLPDVGLVGEIAAVHMIRSLGLPIVPALIFKFGKPRLSRRGRTLTQL